MLVNLEDIYDKAMANQEKLKNTAKIIEQKIEDLESLMASNESKKALLGSIETLTFELTDDLENLKEFLDKLPDQIKSLKAALMEMSLSTGQDGDYVEKKADVVEQLEELEELADDTDKMYDSYNRFQKGKDKIAEQLKNSKSIESIKKVGEALQEHKTTVGHIQSDATDVSEQLNELKRDLGDCSIDTNATKRQNELSLFSTKLDRLHVEFKNLKKANDKNFNKGVSDKIKGADFKLKAFDEDKRDLQKLVAHEVELIKEHDFEDFHKNHDVIKRLRNLKNKIQEADKKLGDIQEVQTEVTRSLTEQDMENSIELLGLKSVELYDRLVSSRSQLKLIAKSGEEMDGNTSNGEEEEFISALTHEMPEVFENIENTLTLLAEVEKLVTEVKQTLNITKYEELKGKVDAVTENVEESDSLVVKLEKEIIEWGAAKKLQRRDTEMDEI